MVNKVLFSSHRTDWRTPESLLAELTAEFGELFDVSHRHEGTFDAFQDQWPPKVYANPPYGPVLKCWLEQAILEMTALTELAVFLLPARTDTIWFHDLVLPYAAEIRFIRGRLRFSGHKSTAPFPSMLVIFRA